MMSMMSICLCVLLYFCEHPCQKPLKMLNGVNKATRGLLPFPHLFPFSQNTAQNQTIRPSTLRMLEHLLVQAYSLLMGRAGRSGELFRCLQMKQAYLFIPYDLNFFASTPTTHLLFLTPLIFKRASSKLVKKSGGGFFCFCFFSRD